MRAGGSGAEPGFGRRLSEGALRSLLALTPAAFRDRYGEEILQTHRDRYLGTRGSARRFFFTVRELLGVTRAVLSFRQRKSIRGRGALDATTQDIRFALRTVRRHPGFSVMVVLILALGIGAATAIFSAANAVFFRPLPFGNPDRLVRLYETNPEFGWTDADAAPANALDWRDQVAAFQDLALYTMFTQRGTVIRNGEPELLNLTSVTGNFFDVLGVEPALGRGFLWEETWAGNDAVVVLSHEVWVSRFGADEGVVGSTLEFAGGSVRVVGVMPEGFRFPSPQTELWTPWGWNPEDRQATWFRRAHWVVPVARLQPGVSVEEADAQLQVVVNRLQSEYPGTNSVMGAGLMPLRTFLVRDLRTPLLVLLGAVGLVLALACVNVANLMLIRVTDRSRELALRLALGAGRLRVGRQLVTEALALALVGGALGLWMGWTGVQLIQRLTPLGIEGATELALDHRVVLFALLAACASGVLFGAAPTVLWAKREGLGEALKEGGRSGSPGRRSLRATNLLVAAEVALAVLIVVGAGLMTRSFFMLRGVNPGFSVENTVAAQFTVPAARYPERNDVLAFYDRFLENLEARPGVEAAGTVGLPPLTGTSWSSQLKVEGWPEDRVGFEILHRRADRGYFEALRIPLLKGRLFDSSDGPDDPSVVVINDAFARQHFPDEDPIGKRITYERTVTDASVWHEIIGVVGDQNQVSPGESPRAEVFENRDQDWGRDLWIVVRFAGEPSSAGPILREVLRELDPLIALASVRSFSDIWHKSVAREEFLLALMGSFGILALVLATVGVYGVTAQAARKRTREIGVRMALGAQDAQVLGLMVRQSMAVVGAGLAAGVVMALLVGRAMDTLLFGVGPTDPATITTVALVLGTAALVACWVPASRAAAADPVDSLRSE